MADEPVKVEWSDTQIWNLYIYLAGIIADAVEQFAARSVMSYPASMTAQEWRVVLDKIVVGFRLLASDLIDSDADQAMTDEAVNLFGRYFRDLWD